MLVRALKNINIAGEKIERGDLVDLPLSEGSLKQLVDRGVISPVQSPPLTALPDFEYKARRLGNLGYVTAASVLEVSPETLAEQLGYTVSTAERWQSEIREWLTEPVRNHD